MVFSKEDLAALLNSANISGNDIDISADFITDEMLDIFTDEYNTVVGSVYPDFDPMIDDYMGPESDALISLLLDFGLRYNIDLIGEDYHDDFKKKRSALIDKSYKGKDSIAKTNPVLTSGVGSGEFFMIQSVGAIGGISEHCHEDIAKLLNDITSENYSQDDIDNVIDKITDGPYDQSDKLQLCHMITYFEDMWTDIDDDTVENMKLEILELSRDMHDANSIKESLFKKGDSFDISNREQFQDLLTNTWYITVNNNGVLDKLFDGGGSINVEITEDSSGFTTTGYDSKVTIQGSAVNEEEADQLCIDIESIIANDEELMLQLDEKLCESAKPHANSYVIDREYNIQKIIDVSEDSIITDNNGELIIHKGKKVFSISEKSNAVKLGAVKSEIKNIVPKSNVLISKSNDTITISGTDDILSFDMVKIKEILSDAGYKKSNTNKNSITFVKK